MKRKILSPLFILVLAGLACNASLPQSTNPPVTHSAIITLTPEGQSTGAVPLTEAQVPRIAVDEAKAAFDSGEAIIVDVRSADAYAASHAEGSINIPLGNFETDIANIQLEKNQWIITYCT